MAKQVKGDTTLALYGGIDLQTRVEIADRVQRVYASLRGDMAGTPTNLLLNPVTFQEKVSRVWDGYSIDPLFQRLVNRTIEFAANGSRWEVPAERSEKSWVDRIKQWMDPKSDGPRLEREETEFWETWSADINAGVPNVLPGLNEITRWAVKHILLSGMFIPMWELGTRKFGKMELIVPTKLTCYPASAAVIVRPTKMFDDEWTAIRLPQGLSAKRVEGQPNLATPSVVLPQGSNAGQYQPLPRMNSGNARLAKDGAKPTESFTLKYNYTPGDLVTVRRGQIATGETMYPQVMFSSLLSQFAIRQKLFAADLAILDGIVNWLEIWKIGDKDNPPQPPKMQAGKLVRDGTIATVRKLIQDGRAGQALQLFIPYYVDLELKMPDTSVLIKETKYIQSTREILQSFGLFYSLGAGVRERMERINITNFEEFVGSIRICIAAFYQMLAGHIVALNPNKLSRAPIWTPNPLNTKSDQFMESLYRLAEMGKVSLRTLLRYHGLEDSVELRRLAHELGTDVDDVTDANVPLRYVQQTMEKDLNEPSPSPGVRERPGKRTGIPPTQQRGRPRKKVKQDPEPTA